ncbi:endonuclease NucS domain-containing protein [Arthrobacter sp. NicSoilB8]|uniref:endonuclease NucS domain-containing protein n=1 Tax=Arthrobacter sp. NicSoilB8 TaxID=2830998 RepID=UPI001CC457DD|nr:endonuclease NucS domain-containing protein [Arthrobacter sp. NicSoilB8]
MAVELGLWRVDDVPRRIPMTAMPLESKLESLILQDPEILEAKLLLIGSQVPTGYGKFIDILGVDSEGTLHILELKRDRTPREVVAQTLDYASWVEGLGNEEVRSIFESGHPGKNFDEEFASRFDGAPVPDELNSSHNMTIVASDLDPSTQRIVSYLNRSHGVPINAMIFRYFVDEGHEYLARTWLIDEDTPVPAGVGTKGSTRAAWNGQDWYVAFGTDGASRSWADASTYGFVSAGGADWYSRTLKSLPLGARVFVHVPKKGYVGVGTVAGKAMPADSAELQIQGETRPFRSLSLEGLYAHPDAGEGVDTAEYVVPIKWTDTVLIEDAYWREGMFANQNSACKLRNQFTIDELSRRFGLAARQ